MPAAAALCAAAEGAQEQLAPEQTAYPQVHHLYYELGRR